MVGGADKETVGVVLTVTTIDCEALEQVPEVPVTE